MGPRSPAALYAQNTFYFLMLHFLGKRRKKFQRYDALEFGVPGFVNHAHAAFTQFFNYFIMCDSFANHDLCLFTGFIKFMTPDQNPVREDMFKEI